jgi:hypothetical protein
MLLIIHKPLVDVRVMESLVQQLFITDTVLDCAAQLRKIGLGDSQSSRWPTIQAYVLTWFLVSSWMAMGSPASLNLIQRCAVHARGLIQRSKPSNAQKL